MATYTASVTNVIDGDTFQVGYGLNTRTIRLANIDAPEGGIQGAAATNYLRNLIGDQTVTIEELAIGEYAGYSS